MFAQRDSGAWTVTSVLSSYSRYGFAFDEVLANAGRARILFHDEEQLYFQEQQVL